MTGPPGRSHETGARDGPRAMEWARPRGRVSAGRETMCRPRHLQSPTGLADGLEVGVLYQRSRLDAPQRVCGHARVGPPYRSADEAILAMFRLSENADRSTHGQGRTYELFMTFYARRGPALLLWRILSVTGRARKLSPNAAKKCLRTLYGLLSAFLRELLA